MPETENIPGKRIDRSKAAPIIAVFKKRFRNLSNKKYPSNVPTSCYVEGVKNKNIFSEEKFLRLHSVYMLFEYDDDLRAINPYDVHKFYINLEPWEDYDFCIFDETFSWCIGATHNNDVIVVDPDGLFNT